MKGDRPRQQGSSSSRKRIVIVGGGLAGLAAAEALIVQSQLPCEVIVLEAKRITGGRAGSFVDGASGETVDYCQHVSMGCCINLMDLMKRCGLSDAFERYQELTFLHPDHPPSRFSPSNILPPPFHLARSLQALRYLSSSQKRAIARGMWKLFRTPEATLVDTTATQWLHSCDQDEATIRDFWAVVIVSALGELPEQTSMAVARKVFVDGFAAVRHAADVLIPRKPLQELFGADLPAALIASGAKVRTGVDVRSVTEQRVALTATDEPIEADHVILATPWHRTGSLLPPSLANELAGVEQFPCSAITGLHLWFDRQFTELPHAVLVGGAAQWLFRQPWSMQQSSEDCYYQVVISASQQSASLSKDELVERVLGELREVFPAAGKSQLLRSRIVKDPRAVFSVTPQVQRLRPASRTPLPWLHLAGDWTQTGWPSTMEGAVISGRKAANSILQSEGKQELEVDNGLPKGWLARQIIVS